MSLHIQKAPSLPGRKRQMLSHHGQLHFASSVVKIMYNVIKCICFLSIQADLQTLEYILTWCCNNSSHWESIANALCQCNHIRNNIVALETPKVASCSSKSSLDLPGEKLMIKWFIYLFIFSPFWSTTVKEAKKTQTKPLIVHKNLIPIGGVVGICNLIKIIKHFPSNAESHSLILACSTFVFLPYSVVTRTKYCHRHQFWWLLNYRRVTYSEHDPWNITVTGGWRIGIYDKSFF